MVTAAKRIKPHLKLATHTIAWLICFSAIFTSTTNNLSYSTAGAAADDDDAKLYQRLREISTVVFNLTQLVAIFFVIFHLYKINDHTI